MIKYKFDLIKLPGTSHFLVIAWSKIHDYNCRAEESLIKINKNLELNLIFQH